MRIVAVADTHTFEDGGLTRTASTTFVNATTWECERAPSVVDIEERAIAPIHIPPRGA